MIKSLRYIAIAIALMLAAQASAARTAQQWIDAAARNITSAGSISASFSISGSGQSGKSSLSASGKCFAINVAGNASWYNGKHMWTYSPQAKETTLFTPSAAELAEVNPLLYIASGARGYTCSMAKGSTAARPVINLVPKSRGSSIKSASITLNGSTLAPVKMVVTDARGAATTVTITSFKRGKAIAAKNFAYPKNKYPGIKIIDLR